MTGLLVYSSMDLDTNFFIFRPSNNYSFWAAAKSPSKINFLKAIEIEKLVEFLDRAKLEFSRCQKTPQKSLSKTL